MPTAARRFCLFSNCSNRVPKGYCAQHAALSRRPTHRDYHTMRWRRYSLDRLSRHPFCAACGRLAEVTDHILSVTTRPDLFWEPSNHRSLCQRCNAKATHRPLYTPPELDHGDSGPVLA